MRGSSLLQGPSTPHCSPTSTLATERGVSCNTAQHPTALASHPESSQLSPSCPSWRGQSPQEKPAPSPLPILQHLHPGVLPLPTWIPPPFLSWELHSVLKAWGGVTSPGSPAQVRRAGRPPGPAPAGKGRERGISAAARRQPAAHRPHASSAEAALVPFGRTNTTQIDIWPKSSASESPPVSRGEDG